MNWPELDAAYHVSLPALFVWYCSRCGSFICACEGEHRLESQYGIVEAIHGLTSPQELAANIEILPEEGLTEVLRRR
jgi:hypothetical protein